MIDAFAEPSIRIVSDQIIRRQLRVRTMIRKRILYFKKLYCPLLQVGHHLDCPLLAVIFEPFGGIFASVHMTSLDA